MSLSVVAFEHTKLHTTPSNGADCGGLPLSPRLAGHFGRWTTPADRNRHTPRRSADYHRQLRRCAVALLTPSVGALGTRLGTRRPDFCAHDSGCIA